MKKLCILVMCLFCLCGCNKNTNGECNKIELYQAVDIKLDCNLKNVTYMNSRYIVSNNSLYIYSDKKFSGTNTMCKKIIDDFKEYKNIGELRDSRALFIKDNRLIMLDSEIEQGYMDITDMDTYANYVKEMNMYSTYYVFGNSRIMNNNIIYDYSLKVYEMNFSQDEKLVYVLSNMKGIVTNKNKYSIEIPKDDKYHDYEDIECNYKLVKTNKFDSFFNDFKNNIEYFNENYLVTKNGKFYRVEFGEFNPCGG